MEEKVPNVLCPDIWRIIFSFLIDGIHIPIGMLLPSKPLKN